MERLDIRYKRSLVSYLRFGVGPKMTFCFHGYGEDALSFAFLERHAGEQYTFFAIDLPFHGQTEWKEGLNCTIHDIRQIIEGILKQTNLQPSTPHCEERSNNLQFSLLGFSLGGRMALSFYEIMPAQVEKLVLLAPDGLVINPWYWLATQTWIGNKLFAFTMKKPLWFFWFLKLLNKLKLVNTSIFKFVNYSIGDKEVRRLLYSRWTGLRKLKPGLGRIKSSIRANKTPVRLIYGRHDRIILPVRGEKFKKGIEEHCTLSVIHSGHQILNEKHVQELLPALLH